MNYCSYKKCKHLAGKNLAWCNPHFDTMIKKIGGMNASFKQFYTISLSKMILESGSFSLKRNENSQFNKPVILGIEHGIKFS